MRGHSGIYVTLIIAAFTPLAAYAIDKVDSPNVDKGELDFEYSGYRSFDSERNKNDNQNNEALIAYAPTDRWELDVGGFMSKAADQSYQVDGLVVENIFQFTEKGSHWVDTGLQLSCNCSTHDNVPASVEAKLLLEKDVGGFVNVANIGLEQPFGEHATGGPDRAFQWSTSYTINDAFAPGFEIQSDFGIPAQGLKWNSGQHYIGPALYGTVLDHFHYEVAYLAGVSSAASDSAVRFLFQYQQHF